MGWLAGIAVAASFVLMVLHFTIRSPDDSGGSAKQQQSSREGHSSRMPGLAFLNGAAKCDTLRM